jgi:hypothetical protein
MRSFLLTALLCSISLLPRPAAADDASHRKLVLEFFRIADMEALMDESMDVMMQAQMQMNPALEPYKDTFKQFLAKYMSWRSLEQEFVTIYVKAFTEPEMQELLKFYKTPTGRKALQQMPKLMQQGAQVGAQRVQEHMPELVQLVQEKAKQQGATGAGARKSDPEAIRPDPKAPGATKTPQRAAPAGATK